MASTYNGTPGNDPGSFGYSYLYGGDGNDELQMNVVGYGEVHGDAGDDIVYMHPYTPGTYGSAYGGDGNDWVGGGNLADSVYGDAGDDYLAGHDGNDLLFGGDGRDAMAGEAGDDAIFGGDGDDSGPISVPSSWNAEGPPLYSDVEAGLFGGAGSDRLFGDKGNDALHGGDDNDVLAGGKGQDLLSGDAGIDVFRFDLVKESKPGQFHRDIILDFEDGEHIDLTLIDAKRGRDGNQAFKYIGDDAFGGKAGELKYAKGLVKADVDGDGHADFQLKIEGSPVLGAEDFLL